MEEQEKLEKGIGNKDVETLKPAKVLIQDIGLSPVKFGSQEREKLNVTVKHPDRDEPIVISKAKVLRKDKVTTSGLWYTTDIDGNIQKGSTLAEFLIYAGVEKSSQLRGMEFDTIADEDGYLVFKAY